MYENVFSYTNCSRWEVLFPGKSEVRSTFFIFFLSGYYYFVFGKILFFHFISSYCECFGTRLEVVEENKTLVGGGSGNCFHFTRTVMPPVFPSIKHKNKTKAMRWHITNGELYEI